jgi:hypothetical protein
MEGWLESSLGELASRERRGQKGFGMACFGMVMDLLEN